VPLLTFRTSAVFQAGGYVVVLVEVSRKAYLASIVPVIVNAVLNEHQIMVDIVTFVGKGDFPRSRLGEKQRGKILAGWVSRKMRTIAQFNIKGADMGLTLGGQAGAPGMGGDTASITDNTPTRQDTRGSLGSFRSTGTGVPGTSSSLRNVEPAPQILEQRELEQQLEGMAALGGGPGALAWREEDPNATPIAEMPADDVILPPRSAGGDSRDGETPTQLRHSIHSRNSYNMPDFGSFNIADDADSRPASKPTSGAPQIRLPGVDGREMPAGFGGDAVDEDDEWAREAGMYMNLAGQLGRKE
jgi:hypothetical protein